MNRLILVAAILFVSAPVLAGAQEFTVKQQMADDLKAVIATVESVHEVQARARISGTVSLLNVKEGDHVETGDKIAVIGDPKLAIKGQGLDARIQAAQSAYDKAKIDFSRASELRQSGYGTQAKLDEARTNLEIAEHNLQAAKSEKQEVTQQATEGAVLAPSAGRVLKVPATLGSVIMAGETVAMLSQENYVLRLELPERHAKYLRAGDTVQIGVRGMQPTAGESCKAGTVRLVYPEIKDGRVIADVEASDLGDYFVGERTRVYVATGKRPTLFAPADYITRRAGIEYAKLKGGTEVVVQTGQKFEEKIEVLSGLNDGDVLVKP
ncbi:MAG: efflux RND transporter periplasmic adaptor subunit [Alphaproteobacteria bacterium]|nr:efflux RND transporter periplasmic adaptor subunit [Alphaproteobacteria bacterium]